MNSSIYRFTLDLHRNQSQISIPVLQGDTSREWHITLSDGGKPYTIADGCLASITIKRPTETSFETFCAIEDNATIVYKFEQDGSTSAVVGINECDVTLYGSDGSRIASPRFTMVVHDRVKSASLTDEDRNTVEDIKAEEAKRQANETARQTAETARVNAETARAEAEEARVSAENTRQANETARQTAETARVNAETARAEVIAEIQEDIENLENSVTVNGVWRWNWSSKSAMAPAFEKEWEQEIDFVTFNTPHLGFRVQGNKLYYLHATLEGGEREMYDYGAETHKNIVFSMVDFGSAPQLVSKEFYSILSACATKLEYTVSGVWTWAWDRMYTEESTSSYIFNHKWEEVVNFTNTSNDKFSKVRQENGSIYLYFADYKFEDLWFSLDLGGYINAGGPTWDFGTEPQYVSKEFYSILTTYATEEGAGGGSTEDGLGEWTKLVFGDYGNILPSGLYLFKTEFTNGDGYGLGGYAYTSFTCFISPEPIYANTYLSPYFKGVSGVDYRIEFVGSSVMLYSVNSNDTPSTTLAKESETIQNNTYYIKLA